jgi:L-methionine (R)-S-oxide reductase
LELQLFACEKCMSHTITINKSLSKEEKYKLLLPQIESLVDGENDLIANISNIIASLKYSHDGFFWVGVYFKKGNELVLGPFQGSVACTRIKIPDGVCGKAVQEKTTIIVDDVNKFSGHIACSTDSKSEIVIPVFNGTEISAVLDIDSDRLAYFDDTDKFYLEKVCGLISELMNSSK